MKITIPTKKNLRQAMLNLLAVAFVFSLLPSITQAQMIESRVKDIAKLDGIQSNVLIGYGLIGGLDGTGDGRRGFTAQTLTNLINAMGTNVITPSQVGTEVVPDNVAAVMVTAKLPPFFRPGMTIDAEVSSIGRSSSFEGGLLYPTAMQGLDGEIYGVASGPVSVGGFRAQGGGGAAGGASVQENHVTRGRISGGIIVEGIPVFHNVLQEGNSLRWLLHEPDFKTASNLQRKINTVCGTRVAIAEDAAAVRVYVSLDDTGNFVVGNQTFSSMVDAIAFIDDIQIATDKIARIVLNENTGTIVGDLQIPVRDVVISHGSLRITIQNTPEVTPSGWLGAAPPVVTQQTEVTVGTGTDKLAKIKGTTLGEVLSNLKALGYSTRDLFSIILALKVNGAIKAEVVSM